MKGLCCCCPEAPGVGGNGTVEELLVSAIPPIGVEKKCGEPNPVGVIPVGVMNAAAEDCAVRMPVPHLFFCTKGKPEGRGNQMVGESADFIDGEKFHTKSLTSFTKYVTFE